MNKFAFLIPPRFSPEFVLCCCQILLCDFPLVFLFGSFPDQLALLFPTANWFSNAINISYKLLLQPLLSFWISEVSRLDLRF